MCHGTTMSKFEINELLESDWREYMSIRLESLQDSPDSFASTYERESSFSSEQWKSRLRKAPSIHDALAIVAVANQQYIGLLSCVVQTPEAISAELYQMWVSPKYRGLGVGTALVDRARTWAVDRNIEKLLLSVTTTNSDAISLYESIGFSPIGTMEPLRTGSALQSQIMQMMLCADDA